LDKEKWPPGIPLRPPPCSSTQSEMGRYQQHHHQIAVFERAFMGRLIDRPRKKRNRNCDSHGTLAKKNPDRAD
jgi:hypothetical protein